MIDLQHITPAKVEALHVSPDPTCEWLHDNHEIIQRRLQQQGWVLMRGSAVRDAAGFAMAFCALGLEAATEYSDLPRESSYTGVFRTTEYPATDSIYFHSEASHLAAAPRHILFVCIKAADSGGTTPLSDNLKSFTALPKEIAQALQKHGLRYERNFISGLDVSWQKFFNTEDREKVAALAVSDGFEVEWSSGDVLRTYSTRAATARFPNGRIGLFQQIALHHPAFLDQELRTGLAQICGGVQPRNVTFGNGDPIPDCWAHAIHDTQCGAAFAFDWHSGDMLLVDNARMSHARTPFFGQRDHLVMLSRFSKLADEPGILKVEV